MSVRAVRLDNDAENVDTENVDTENVDTENVLEQLVQATGLSISGVFKRGLLSLRDEVAKEKQDAPYEIYRQLDLGPGGYSIAPSTETRGGVREAIRRKLGR